MADPERTPSLPFVPSARRARSLAGNEARAELAGLAREHRLIGDVVRRLRASVYGGASTAIEQLGAEAALRLHIQAELGEQVLYPAADGLGDDAVASVERLRLLNAHARVLIDDLRLEHGDPHHTALLADELARICARFVDEHESLLRVIEHAAVARTAVDHPPVDHAATGRHGVGAALALALEQLLEAALACRQPARGTAGAAGG
jgi:hypothetical protein